jgi:hypothetical protein
MDRFCKTCLGLIVLLLFVIAVRPTVIPQSVNAQSKKPSDKSSSQPDGTSIRVWRYSYTCAGGTADETVMTPAMDELNVDAIKGWEVVSAIPIAGSRRDNAAMGTVNICFILRSPR